MDVPAPFAGVIGGAAGQGRRRGLAGHAAADVTARRGAVRRPALTTAAAAAASEAGEPIAAEPSTSPEPRRAGRRAADRRTGTARSTPARRARRTRPRARRRPLAGERHRPQGPDHHARTSRAFADESGRLRLRRPAPALGLDLPPWPSIDFEKFGPVERVAALADPADLGARTWPATG